MTASVEQPDESRWNVQLFGTALADVTNRDVAMGGATAGIGYYVLDNLAINAEFSGYHVDQDDAGGASAGGASIGLRHHVLEFGESSTSLFLDVGVGYLKCDDRIPPGGTTSNTTFHAGVGLAYPIDDHVYLIGGARYFHLSNADREGDDRNPSINAVQGFVGIMIRF